MKLDQSFRLRLRDVLVLSLNQLEDGEREQIDQLATYLTEVCRIPVIILFDGMTLDSIPEQDMVKRGWVRMERRTDGARD